MSRVCLVLICVALSAAGGIAAEVPAEPKPGVSFRLERPASAADIMNGKELAFIGDAPRAIRNPTKSDFRLEQTKPIRRFVPLVFGRRERIFPPEGSARGVQLVIRYPMAKTWKSTKMFGKKRTSRFAEALFRAGAEYRLTWTCRFADEKRPVTRHCDFRIAGPNDGLPAATRSRRRCYRVEILYRRREAKNVVFLAQHFMAPSQQTRPRHRLRRGLTAKANRSRHPIPDMHGSAASPVSASPAAGSCYPTSPSKRTPTESILEKTRDGRERVSVRVSDVATGAKLPGAKTRVTYTLYSNALFRIEELTNNAEMLRQDPDYWRTRIREIAVEVAKRKDVKPEIRRWIKAANGQ